MEPQRTEINLLFCHHILNSTLFMKFNALYLMPKRHHLIRAEMLHTACLEPTLKTFNTGLSVYICFSLINKYMA